MIRCVAFDFDGTLVHSNRIKRDAMLEIAAGYPNGRAIMEAILAAPPGDRHAILSQFASRVGADREAGALVEAYGTRCAERILRCPARRGAAAALSALRTAGLGLYINSATPTGPLREIVERRYGAGAFAGVLGSEGTKTANLGTIMKAEGVGPDETAMVGDGIDDHDAARETGVRFFGITGGTLAAAARDGPLLGDLCGLPALICASPA